MHSKIAIVGPIASGKTTTTEYLSRLGYQSYRLSSGIYDELTQRGIETETRTILQDIGDELREEFGPDILAQRAIEKFDASSPVIFESIRNHHEVLLLKKNYPNLLVLAINTPLKTRYQRLKDRSRSDSETELTFEEFEAIHKRDMGFETEEEGQNVWECMQLADICILNYGSKQDLINEISNLIESI